MESVKAVSDLVSPVSGTVCAVNEELLDAPELLNSQCYDAWIIKVEALPPRRSCWTRRDMKRLWPQRRRKMGSYIPATGEERQAMLQAIGLTSVDELFDVVPERSG